MHSEIKVFSTLIKKIARIIIACWCFSIFTTPNFAQDSTAVGEEPIGVIARPSADSIALRWAPTKASHWLTANKFGYIVERYAVVKNGVMLKVPEKTILSSSPIKPWPEEQWAKYTSSKYAMVAAQALFGETFEINIEQSDVMQIVNKSRENEQRFSIALFCADMSPIVAKASGLYYVDKNIQPNTKYLYRISVQTPTDTLRGSIFIDTNEKYVLPKVIEASAESSANIVSLKWNQQTGSRHYTSYSIERSENGKDFLALSDITNVGVTNQGKQDPRYQYASDTLAMLDKEYSYRIRGVTPFGEHGPASDIVSVKGTQLVTANVFITSALSTDNKTIDVQWEFPQSQELGLKGFEVTRAQKSSGPYKSVHRDVLPVSSRAFKDITPEQTSYYKVKAHTLDGREITSMPYLTLLVDSVPPATPTGLSGKVDQEGRVRISWKPNPDSDIYGYRIYRAYYKSEEFAQLTAGPLQDTIFNDRVTLKSLNEKVHYKIMAIDKNQNHSTLSATLSLSLPDKVPPMPPVWLPVKSIAKGVTLTWLPGGSEDVTSYALYRKESTGWKKIFSTPANSNDTSYTYTDTTLQTTEAQHYTILAIDDAGLESPPSPVVSGFKLPQNKEAVKLKLLPLDRSTKQITIAWSHTGGNVANYRIYKKINDNALQLYKTTRNKEFTDTALSPGQTYTYQVMIVFTNGALSDLSKKVVVDY
ncbi:fibronectin type III domain-containing protein [Pseudochryseolinea flava]|uniref:Fibronectin type-III domain-containing protein n=1 Tax=Pseudochryseolinea flava TaxID=2059302 RepID=A0A364Y562_9BACT|nr:hypothetical protein [Pseudochryseolinea flava]RAW02136.1 hypothetical protein DQQ10_06195 [Pseudochryseolinea flava]